MTGSNGTPPRPAIRVLTPEEIAMQAGRQAPAVRLPERLAVFADRQLRLRQLAVAHPMREYLLFIAELASAQHAVLQTHATVAMPDADACAAARGAGIPPAPAASWPRDPVWRTELRRLLGTVRARLGAGAARDTLDRLVRSADGWIDGQADRLSRRITLGLDLATAPLIAAGLQAYWTQLVTQLASSHGERIFGATEPATQCPCCGSLPTASITRIGADESGLRYLHCSLCSTQWHFVRIKCTHCDSTKGIHYQELQPQAGPGRLAATARPGAVRAECCDACGRYLKLVSMEKDVEVEPVADDLASVALDLLVSEAGLERSGHNLMLLFGDPDGPHSAHDGAHDDGGGG